MDVIFLALAVTLATGLVAGLLVLAGLVAVSFIYHKLVDNASFISDIEE